LLITISSCKTDDTLVMMNTPSLFIDSISPNSAPAQTEITINGSGFGLDPSIASVFFNDVEAVITSITDNQLIAIVPLRSFSGSVRIRIGDNEITGPAFNYLISDINVTTVASGNGLAGYMDGSSSSNVLFNAPRGIVITPEGDILIADGVNHAIRRITPDGTVSTFAGNGDSGFQDGLGTNARFSFPSDLAIDNEGNIFVADTFNHAIRRITPAGEVSTVAGGTSGYEDGTVAVARFNVPRGLFISSNGNIIVADALNAAIRSITPEGDVTTIAGNGVAGFENGDANEARFSFPANVIEDNNNNILVADAGNHAIRLIKPTGTVSTLFGNGTAGFEDGSIAEARFNFPSSIAIDVEGSLVIADTDNNAIRKINREEGIVTTIAGNGDSNYVDGPISNARFDKPRGIAIENGTNILIADEENHAIRSIIRE